MASRLISCCCPWRYVQPDEELTPRLRPRSPDYPFRSLVERGETVLNRGLGALNRGAHHVDNDEEHGWNSSSLILVIVGGLITIPSAFTIEVNYENVHEQTFFKDDLAEQSAGYARIVAIPLTCAAVNFLLHHIRRTTFWWDRSGSTCCGCDPISFWPMLLVALGLLRSACLKLITEGAAEHVAFYIEILISLLWLKLYYALLDHVDAIVKGMAKEQEGINNTAPVKKMQQLVRNITRSNKQEKDVVYCFAQTNTVPAKVLSYVWWTYYVVGKVVGAGIIVGVFMGIDSSVVGHSLVGVVFFSAATASGFVFELGPNALSLFRLSLNKPFYVGDLVTLNSNGAMDTPSTSIMGFVENITMMYVVVRNFEMKQTWIPHKVFGSLIIQNWTRRPSKTVLLNIGISCRCPVKKVDKLTAFGKRWIQSSEEIQQTNYQKCHITKIANGYNIEVIFFPAIGVSHRGIRQKFLVAFMAAAERLQVPFVPLNINQNYCEETATAGPPLPFGMRSMPSNIDENASAEEFTPTIGSVTFDDLMPDPNDRLPKGVGMGFREFPVSSSHSNIIQMSQDATSVLGP
mmetsp:Transcript_87875/g.137664  ORF Transcript_87875/g.137664 Transcript_87875/m.137664 type:complete len:574 (-) Transcript_87875:192-1913(-)